MKVLVTGATGAVGPSVIDALLRAGHTVRVMSRGDGARNDVEVVRGDITDPDAVLHAVTSCEAVIHLAALLHVANAPAAAYERVNVGGTRNVVAAAASLGVRRIIFGSTIAVYGYDRQVVLDETMALLPDTDYARSKAAAEVLVRAAGGVVLRFAAVYGTRVKGNYQRLVKAMRRGLFIPIGNGRNRRTVIYDEDVAAAVVAVLEAEQASGQTYNVAAPHIPEVREIVAAIAEALGRRPPRVFIPLAVVKMFAPTRRLRMMIDKYVEDVAVSADKLRDDVGFVAPTHLREGWRRTIAGLRELP